MFFSVFITSHLECQFSWVLPVWAHIWLCLYVIRELNSAKTRVKAVALNCRQLFGDQNHPGIVGEQLRLYATSLQACDGTYQWVEGVLPPFKDVKVV